MAGIYIHIPFCKTRCIYCDFYSTTWGNSRSKTYIDQLLAEAKQRAPQLQGQAIRTLYIGGGTPSQLPATQLTRLLEGLSQIFNLRQLTECTIEVNPEDIVHGGFTLPLLPPEVGCGWRVSMGVQSFVDAELQLLHRRHTVQTAREAVAMLRAQGVSNLSLDLMYGLPLQTLTTFTYSIAQALELQPQHVSAYNLQVEEGTPLHQLVEKGTITVASDEVCLAMNDQLRRMLREAGFLQYEISNYALPGFQSQHNSSYWVGTPYLGLGPGAHSYDGQFLRTWNEPDLHAYLQGNCPVGTDQLTPTDVRNEQIMLGLRTRQGIPAFTSPVVSSLLERNLLTLEADRLRLSEQGLALADEVIRELFI